MEIRLIPTTLGFLADSEGNVYDHHTVKRTTYRNLDGYVTTNVLRDGEWETVGVHRLVALAFHGLPKEGFDHVNHRDGDVENNRPSNLEWVSAEQNNIHAEIFRKDNHRPSIIASMDHPQHPETMFFMNVWDASKLTGFEPLAIWDAIKNGTCVDEEQDRESSWITSWTFTFHSYSSNIPKELQKDRIKKRGNDGRMPERSVKIRPIDSEIDDGSDVFRFSSIGEAARYFGVGTSAIHQAIPQRDVVRVFKKKYQIAYDDQEFPELSEEDWERAKNSGPRDVVAYHYPTDRIYIFPSAAAFVEHSKLSKKAVMTALANNRLRKIGDWVSLYYDNEISSALVMEYVKGSSPDVTP